MSIGPLTERSILAHPSQPPQQWHQIKPTWMLQTISLSSWLHPKPRKGGESPGRALTQFFFIFLKNLSWGKNLSFTIKLRQRYRNFTYTSCPHPCFASLLFSHQHLNITPQSGIFFLTKDEHIIITPNPKFTLGFSFSCPDVSASSCAQCSQTNWNE